MSSSTSKRSETVIALDLATKCGWAVLRGRKRIDSGRWTLYRKSRHRAMRWLDFESQLTELVEHYEPEVVAFERVRRHIGVGAAHVYGGFLASLERLELQWQNELEIPVPEIVPIEISTWRKVATGRGDACKEEVKRWVRRNFRFTAKSDDEAEAIAIAEAIRRIRGGEYAP